MSNARKLRHSFGDSERERRHLAWLNESDNGARIAAATVKAYADQGRGCWFASQQEANMAYISQADLTRFPAGHNRDVVERMIATYNPAYQVVVVIEDEGINAYKVRLVPIADPAMN